MIKGTQSTRQKRQQCADAAYQVPVGIQNDSVAPWHIIKTPMKSNELVTCQSMLLMFMSFHMLASNSRIN